MPGKETSEIGPSLEHAPVPMDKPPQEDIIPTDQPCYQSASHSSWINREDSTSNITVYHRKGCTRSKLCCRIAVALLLLLFLIIVIVLLVLYGASAGQNSRQSNHSSKAFQNPYRILGKINQQSFEEWAAETNTRLAVWKRKIGLAYWDYLTNLTDENAKKLRKVEAAYHSMGIEGFQSPDASWNKTLVRMWNRSQLGEIPLPMTPAPEGESITDMLLYMEKVYGSAEVHKDGKTFRREPEFTQIMDQSRDWDKLLWAWEAWRNAIGPKTRNTFTALVNAINKAAKEHGYDNLGETWRKANFEEDGSLILKADELYQELQPLYEQLHAYVRAKLMDAYPNRGMKSNKPIPAHILGSLGSSSWSSILDLVLPYPNSMSYDITQTMKDKKMTPRDIFELADEFFVSLGMDRMTETFWKKSMIVRPEDGRKVDCHAAAHDLYADDCTDFRIKMCTEVNMDYWNIIHHEMGHIQYYMQYCPQPTLFHDSANSAFHEAVGDTIALSVMSPKHLRALKLLEEEVSGIINNEAKKRNINVLMKVALDKIAFLPFGYLVDKWRWQVFSGSITPEEYNQKWWQYRTQYQGIKPPVERKEGDFDPGSIYHITTFVPFIRYFFSNIVQFQFHEALCKAAKHTGPLFECDIYKSKEAGQLLMSMMKLGSSVPWPDAMEKMTGQREFSAGAFKNYFQPLTDWLMEQNARTNIGWESY